jgi:hypothetical protein
MRDIRRQASSSHVLSAGAARGAEAGLDAAGETLGGVGGPVSVPTASAFLFRDFRDMCFPAEDGDHVGRLAGRSWQIPFYGFGVVKVNRRPRLAYARGLPNI